MSNHEYYLIAEVKRNALKIGKSDIFISIVTQSYLDSPYCAMQLGLAIILDKPIRLLVKEGTKLPKSLEKICERIEYYSNPDDIGLVSNKLLDDLK